MLGALSLRLDLNYVWIVPLTLAIITALFIKKTTLQKILSALLWMSSLIWPWVAWMRVNERLASGQPWVRLVAIFIGVTLFTSWSGWLLHVRQKKDVNHE
jgi:hypothetical protein